MNKYIIEKIVFWVFRLMTLIVVGILVWILGFIAYHGIQVLSWDFLTKMPEEGMTKGGIFPAIVGTVCLMVGSMIFAFPIGVMSAIYLNEFLGEGKIKSLINLMTDNLAGIPSIVFGLFGMALFVNKLHFGDSIIALLNLDCLLDTCFYLFECEAEFDAEVASFLALCALASAAVTEE